MNRDSFLEDRLESFGTRLREWPAVTPSVIDQLRQATPISSLPPMEGTTSQVGMRGGRRLLAVTSTLAAIVVPLLAVTLFPSRSVAWTEVVQAIQSQNWIRGTKTDADGKRSTMWLSPKRETWAFDLNGAVYFYDGREKAKYELSSGGKAITKLPLGEDDAQRVLPINALSQGQSSIGSWIFGTEKIVDQKQREVTEDGKTWLDFQLVLWRGDMNHVTLRVDPETKLPVYLAATSAVEGEKTLKWGFDYPADGPSDIYALGVSRGLKIDDRMPADNVMKVLAAVASSRKSIGNFRFIIDQSAQYASSVVYRKGNKWRIETGGPQFIPKVIQTREMIQTRDWDKWLKDQDPVPSFICDGTTVWQKSTVQPGEVAQWKKSERVAPQDLLSGEGPGMLPGAPGAKFASLVYPDLSPKVGWGFEFDANPTDAPGCVLLKRSASVTLPENAVGHEWYYLDPAKGYAVVRAELFTLTSDVPATPEAAGSHRQTTLLKDFERSPQGFWYPTIVDDKVGGGLGVMQSTANWHFDFDIDLPDSLFSVDVVPQK